MDDVLWLGQAKEAFRLIDRVGCQNFTSGRCLDPHSGRTRGAKYLADAWCDACIARDFLDALTEEGWDDARTKFECDLRGHPAYDLITTPLREQCLCGEYVYR